MKPLSIKEIRDAVGGRIIREGSSQMITGVSTDTRTIQPGDLFIPLEGERFDGHDYLAEAAEKGAAAVLTHNLNKTLPQGVHTIVTGNTLTALQDLAAWYLKSFSVDVIAITGSTGKTTTKDMVSSVLSRKFQVLKTQGNLNNEIGLPLTLFRLEPHHQIAVLEMGMSGFGEIRRLAAIAPPKAAIFTNIGISHIEKLGSRDNIWKAKSELLEHFHEGCTVILNDDNDILHREAEIMMRDRVGCKVIRFGTGSHAEFCATDIQSHENGISYTLKVKDESFGIRLNVPGIHNVYNSLAAVAAGRMLGMEMQEIQAGLLEFAGDNMRLHIFPLKAYKDVKVIDDTYNASPDSMQAALRVLKDMEGHRKIAILGDMLELGMHSREAHRQVGRFAAECGIHILATRGQESVWAGEGALQAGMPSKSVFHVSSNQEIIHWLKNNIYEGDRILVKGSRGMQMEEIVSFLKDGGSSE